MDVRGNAVESGLLKGKLGVGSELWSCLCPHLLDKGWAISFQDFPPFPPHDLKISPPLWHVTSHHVSSLQASSPLPDSQFWVQWVPLDTPSYILSPRHLARVLGRARAFISKELLWNAPSRSQKVRVKELILRCGQVPLQSWCFQLAHSDSGKSSGLSRTGDESAYRSQKPTSNVSLSHTQTLTHKFNM